MAEIRMQNPNTKEKFAYAFVSDFGTFELPQYATKVYNCVQRRKDGHFDRRFRLGKLAIKMEKHLNDRAQRGFMKNEKPSWQRVLMRMIVDRKMEGMTEGEAKAYYRQNLLTYPIKREAWSYHG